MDLFNSWKSIGTMAEEGQLLETEKVISSKGKGMVATMIRGLKIKLGWIVLFIVSFLVGMFFLKENLLAVFVLLSFTVCYLIGGVLIYVQVRRLEAEEKICSKLNTLEYLKKQFGIISQVIKSETKMGAAFMPFAALGGTLIGLSYDGQILELTNNDLLRLFVLVAVSTALGILLSKWMTKKAFGEKLQGLQKQIDLLEELN